MTNPRSDRLIPWSISTYWLILQAYPHSFRREYGESMVQVFGDSARDAWKRAGLAGLAILWIRTIRDVAVSVFRAYSIERRDGLFRLWAGATMLYVTAVVCIVGYGALEFREFYQPPSFSVFGAPDAHENALIAAHEQALGGEFGRYRVFARVAGFSLALLLGATSALFGLWQRSLLHSTGALLAGSAFTVVAFELLPTVWFPLDRYAVGALWVMGGGVPLAACTWLLVMVLGHFRPARFTHS